MGRIITPPGFASANNDGKPQKEPTLQERVQLAIDNWANKNHDIAFGHALNAIVYLSAGLSGLAKLVKKLEAENVEVKKVVATLEKAINNMGTKQ